MIFLLWAASYSLNFNSDDIRDITLNFSQGPDKLYRDLVCYIQISGANLNVIANNLECLDSLSKEQTDKFFKTLKMVAVDNPKIFNPCMTEESRAIILNILGITQSESTGIKRLQEKTDCLALLESGQLDKSKILQFFEEFSPRERAGVYKNLREIIADVHLKNAEEMGELLREIISNKNLDVSIKFGFLNLFLKYSVSAVGSDPDSVKQFYENLKETIFINFQENPLNALKFADMLSKNARYHARNLDNEIRAEHTLFYLAWLKKIFTKSIEGGKLPASLMTNDFMSMIPHITQYLLPIPNPSEMGQLMIKPKIDIAPGLREGLLEKMLSISCDPKNINDVLEKIFLVKTESLIRRWLQDALGKVLRKQTESAVEDIVVDLPRQRQDFALPSRCLDRMDATLLKHLKPLALQSLKLSDSLLDRLMDNILDGVKLKDLPQAFSSEITQQLSTVDQTALHHKIMESLQPNFHNAYKLTIEMNDLIYQNMHSVICGSGSPLRQMSDEFIKKLHDKCKEQLSSLNIGADSTGRIPSDSDSDLPRLLKEIFEIINSDSLVETLKERNLAMSTGNSDINEIKESLNKIYRQSADFKSLHTKYWSQQEKVDQAFEQIVQERAQIKWDLKPSAPAAASDEQLESDGELEFDDFELELEPQYESESDRD